MDSLWYEGTIVSFNKSGGFGYIKNDKFKKVLVHSRSLGIDVKKEMILPGIRVKYQLEFTRTGYVGRYVTPIEPDMSTFYDEEESLAQVKQNSKNGNYCSEEMSKPEEFLAAALIAREQKEYEKARRIYNNGLKIAPSVHLVTSLAAFEKNVQQPERARKAYETGVKLYPKDARLHELAGILDFRLNNMDAAIKHFSRALSLNPAETSQAIIQIFLCKAYFYEATRNPNKIDIILLNKARDYIEKASKRKNLTAEELIIKNRIISIKIKSHLAIVFVSLEKLGFSIKKIFKPNTEFIDFLIEPHSTELRSSYNMEEPIVVRYLLMRPKVNYIDSLDRKLQALVDSGHAEPGFAFVVIKDSNPLMGVLRRRLESGGQVATIVPFLANMFENNYNRVADKIHEVLNQWLFKRDLYKDNFPVSGSHFFGRERHIKTLFESVTDGRHVGIFGLRKVGKTSFLWRVKERCDVDLVAYVDLLSIPSAVKNCDYLFWTIGNEIYKDLTNKYDMLAKNNDFQMFGIYSNYNLPSESKVSLMFDNDLNLLRKLISTLKIDSVPKIIILIDEVERLLPLGKVSKGFDGYYDFFSYWRGQAQQHKDVVTVITGANSAIVEQPHWDLIDNPVYKFYEEEYLPPLEFPDCSSMVKELGAKMGISYTGGALKKIYELTGGHPFITRRFCSRISQHTPLRPLNITLEDARKAEEQFLIGDSDLFDEILERLKRDFPLELKVLQFVVQKGSATSEELQSFAGAKVGPVIRHLTGYQIMKEENGEFTIGLDLLRDYMNACAL